ncbi:MAG TPA: tyrosine-type recombinase/integrase [Candidatus Methylacidiphilales bacterium]|nr:tyrosine-type recombinase/integrase [Candidatus Methylacidiphilales bacterium]
METRYKVYQRRNGIYYIQDVVTNQQESLRTRDRKKALALLVARNQAVAQPALNVTMAKAYLSGRSPELASRTWHEVLEEMILGYQGSTKKRFKNFAKSAPIQSLRRLPLIETEASHFLNALRHPRAGSSTNKWMRIVHNRALDLGWLLAPVLARKCWPKFRTQRTIAITLEQHRRLIQAELDEEFGHYLEVLWETGGAQTDIACLHRDNVDLINRRLTFNRRKLEHRSMGNVAIVIGENLQRVLDELPATGYLFPTLVQQDDKVRASRFRKVADRQGFTEISLHSYRYAWAQRAKSYGMPMREAMAHLGHGSKGIHQAYSEKAEVVTLPLEFYEKQWKEKILQFATGS